MTACNNRNGVNCYFTRENLIEEKTEYIPMTKKKKNERKWKRVRSLRIVDHGLYISRRVSRSFWHAFSRQNELALSSIVNDAGKVSGAPDGRANSTPRREPSRSRKGTRSFRIYLYNTYKACIQSTQTSCRRGLANPFPSSSPKASKERSFESPFVNMGFGRKEDDATESLRLWLKI